MQNFSFNQENLVKAQEILTHYPAERKQSAILYLLDLAQRQNGGWLSVPALEYVASYLNIAYVRVYEIASFYSMFNLNPVGKYHIQVCRTLPCWLNGAQDTLQNLENALGIKCGQTTEDGVFTLGEIECLGACTKAPVVKINDQYYEQFKTSQDILKLLQELKEKTTSK